MSTSLDILDQLLEKKKDVIQKELDKSQSKSISSKKLNSEINDKKMKNHPEFCERKLGSKKWVDKTLTEWDENDYRIFVGNIGDEVTDDHLIIAFRKYPSFIKAKVVKERYNGKPRGYGFVSFKKAQDFVRAMKEMNGKYIGKKPVMLKKSEWKKRINKKIKKNKFH